MASSSDIIVSHVTKEFGPVRAVDDLSFTVRSGRVTGFLGPNGSGKTTTLRILLGLVRASSGEATFAGTRYADLTHPLTHVGASLEATSFHPGRSALNHLRSYAPLAQADDARCRDLLALVGLAQVADQRIGGFLWGCASVLLWLRPCWATPIIYFSMSPRTGWIPLVFGGCVGSCGHLLSKARPCWCRRTCCRRCSTQSMMWSSSRAGNCATSRPWRDLPPCLSRVSGLPALMWTN